MAKLEKSKLYILAAAFGAASVAFFFYVDSVSATIAMMAVAAKSKILYFLKKSAAKIITFVKTLTIVKLVSISVKRFLIDNVFSIWFEKNVIQHIKKPIVRFFKHYWSLDWKRKIVNALYVILPVSAVLLIADLEQIALFLELKAIIIAFFKFIWVFFSKIYYLVFDLFFNSYIAPILQIIALSYILEKLERIPYVGRPLAIFFSWIEKWIAAIASLLKKYIVAFKDRLIGKRVRVMTKIAAKKINRKIDLLKLNEELAAIRRFGERFPDPNLYFLSEVSEYLKKTGSRSVEGYEKLRFYDWHNRKTKDGINVVAFGGKSPITEKEISDVLVIESFASNFSDGGGSSLKIKKEDAWILNLSLVPISIAGKKIPPKKLRLVRNFYGSGEEIGFMFL